MSLRVVRRVSLNRRMPDLGAIVYAPGIIFATTLTFQEVTLLSFLSHILIVK
jgi:hypothetical protein